MKTVQYTLKVAIVKPQIDIMTSNIFLGGEQIFVMKKIIEALKGLCFYKGRWMLFFFLNEYIIFLISVKATSH